MEDKKSQNKTVFVRNLPFSINNSSLEKTFSKYGKVKRAFIVTSKDTQKSKGYGYVTFNSSDDCEKLFTQQITIEGRMLFLSNADSKNNEKSLEHSKEINDTGSSELLVNNSLFPILSKKASRNALIITNVPVSKSIDEIKPTFGNSKSIRKISVFSQDENVYNILILYKDVKHASFSLKQLNRKKDFEAIKYTQFKTNLNDSHNVKKNRLIVRNLSFKTTEEHLKVMFEKYGVITEILIPNANGKKKGFAIVQFEKFEDASNALKSINELIIDDRPVAVDWLLPKNMFERNKLKDYLNIDNHASITSKKKNNKHAADDSNEDINNYDTNDNKYTTDEVNQDENDDDSDSNDDYDDKNNTDNSAEEDIKSDDDEDDDTDDGEDDDENADNDDDDDGEEDDSCSDVGNYDENNEIIDNAKQKNGKNISNKKLKGEVKNELNDAENGKTLFIRNLSFNSIEEDLEEIFEQFGELEYCRIVLDSKTEHSRGMAFVQFKSIEDADMCLKDSEDNGISIDGRKLIITKALSREKANQMSAKRKSEVLESAQGRNLHLIRLTLIRPGTKAAEELSNADLGKRMKVEAIMREKLKNPNIFVSPTRICVRNIPTSIDDNKLKQIFLKASDNKSAKITECRIMRDLSRVNAEGQGKSRGYAFICFSRHEDALAAVTNTNNNAEIFGKHKRLIVEFSLENKSALISKERRKERTNININATRKRLTTKDLSNRVRPVIETKMDETISKKLPTHWGPKVRHKKRGLNSNVRKKKPEKQINEKERQRKPKLSKYEIRDKLDTLIDKYKRTV